MLLDAQVITDKRARANEPVWPVMVLAHDEERNITACLDSILAAEPARAFEVYVMANGCTDRTEDVVEEYGRQRPEVRLVSLARGDKCNAWNVYVHQTVPALCAGRGIYFFMNGDARAVPGSFTAMDRALEMEPHANAASTGPASGRNARRARQELIDRHGLYANLYALRGSFVERLRALSVRMPLNFEGDDGLVGALVKWDLAPERNFLDDRRIVPCAAAGFEFDSMSPLRLVDWKIYWKRMIRYGRQKYEFQLLGPRLRERGIAALPNDISELYSQSGKLRLRWDGVYTLTNWIALRQMRKFARS